MQAITKTNIKLKMKLTKKAKAALDKNNAAKARICAEFNCSYDTAQRWIRENSEDNKLTTVRAVSILSETLGLKQDEIIA